MKTLKKRGAYPPSAARYVGCRKCDERDSFAYALLKHLQRLNSNSSKGEIVFRSGYDEQPTCGAAIADEPFLRRTSKHTMCRATILEYFSFYIQWHMVCGITGANLLRPQASLPVFLPAPNGWR
jgi:hypothetical protein